DWRITSEGALSNNRTDATLTGQKDYANFEVKVEVKITAKADAALRIRFQQGSLTAPTWYAVRLSLEQRRPLTGSIVKCKGVMVGTVARVAATEVMPETWFQLHVLAIANRIIVSVNGKTVADYVDKNNPLLSGNLAFHASKPGPTVLFRNPMVKQLPDDKA